METTRSDDSSSLARISKEMMVAFSLPVDEERELIIEVGKNGNPIDRDYKTDEYSIVKRASKPEFYRSYHELLRCFHQVDMTSGEFYLIKKKGLPATGMAWFSAENVRRLGLYIDFYNADRVINLSIDCNIQLGKNVRHFRKAANTIDQERFYFFLRILFNYLHDYENLASNLKPLFDQFREIAIGSKPDVSIEANWHLDNSIAMEKIANRISSIEKRLLEIDSDTSEDRIRMRGELEGLRFALITMKAD